MKKQITPDEFFKLFGEMFAGMSVPGSMGLLGAACKPWGLLKTELRIPGYPDAEECAAAARKVFDDSINANSLARRFVAMKASYQISKRNAEDLRAALISAMPTCKTQVNPESTETCGKFASWGFRQSFLSCEEHKFPDAPLHMKWEAARLLIENTEGRSK
jgi:hypothetical protein